MRLAVWGALGLVLGLALGASAQRNYTHFYDSGVMAAKSATFQTIYVTGVFDTLREVVEANDTKSPRLQPRNLARAYTCMQGLKNDASLAIEANEVWVQNRNSRAAEALLIVAGNLSFGKCKGAFTQR